MLVVVRLLMLIRKGKMILRSKYLNGQFDKIAKKTGSIVGAELGSSYRSRVSNSVTSDTQGMKQYNYGTRDNDINLQSTLSKSRDKSDLQPLHKNTGINYKPADSEFASRMRSSQERLSDIEDKRITRHKLRNK